MLAGVSSFLIARIAIRGQSNWYFELCYCFVSKVAHVIHLYALCMFLIRDRPLFPFIVNFLN